MLAYVLALVVGLGSVALYMAAFFFPEVHRKNDFILSGIGMFYALVLWVCAGRITGGLLLGQMAGVVLVGWLGWETLNLRRGMTPTDQQTAVPSAAAVQAALANLTKPEALAGLPGQIGAGLSQFAGRVQAAIAAGSQAKKAAADAVAPYVPLKREDFAGAVQDAQNAADTVMDAAVQQAETVTQDVQETVADGVQRAETGVQNLREMIGDTVAAAVPAVTPAAGPDLLEKAKGAIAAIAAAIPTVLQGLTKKKESQPIYVRKQFRRDGVASDAAQSAVEGVAEQVEVVKESVAEAIAVTESAVETAVETALESGAAVVVTASARVEAAIAPDVPTVRAAAESAEADEATAAATINAFADAHEVEVVPAAVGVEILVVDEVDADEFEHDWRDTEGSEPDSADRPIDPPFIDE